MENQSGTYIVKDLKFWTADLKFWTAINSEYTTASERIHGVAQPQEKEKASTYHFIKKPLFGFVGTKVLDIYIQYF